MEDIPEGELLMCKSWFSIMRGSLHVFLFTPCDIYVGMISRKEWDVSGHNGATSGNPRIMDMS